MSEGKKREEDSNLDSHNLVLRKEHTSFTVYLVVVLYPRVAIVFVIFLAELIVIYIMSFSYSGE